MLNIIDKEQIKIENLIKNKCLVELSLLREDQIHPTISGNKFRKLKYNLIAAKQNGYKKVVSFGGAYSNHIEALSYACKEENLKCIGVIRGEELINKEFNPTLKRASANEMQLEFVTREVYRTKSTPDYIKALTDKFGPCYIIPEGGTNELAIKGCEEILSKEDKEFDVIACSVGTGGTISGIINSSNLDQQIIGFPALKGDYLNKEIEKYTNKKNWVLNSSYNFGGYGKVTKELIDFINIFKDNYGVQLDPIYTGKMMFGIFDMIKKGEFKKNTSILAIHTGGLQGIDGMNQLLKRKGLPIIKI